MRKVKYSVAQGIAWYTNQDKTNPRIRVLCCELFDVLGQCLEFVRRVQEVAGIYTRRFRERLHHNLRYHYTNLMRVDT